MSPEAISFLTVFFALGGWAMLALVLRWVARRDVRVELRRLRVHRRRERARVRAVFSRPAPRAIGFLSHLVTRDSEPPSSALVHVLPARPPVIYTPESTDDTRGVMRPRCRTR